MIPMNRSSFGRAGGSLRRYPGGTENASIFATVLGRSRIAALPRAGSALPRTLLAGPARTLPRLSSLPPPTSSVEGYLVMEFYSGATALHRRFTEGFRRLHVSEKPYSPFSFGGLVCTNTTSERIIPSSKHGISSIDGREWCGRRPL